MKRTKRTPDQQRWDAAFDAFIVTVPGSPEERVTFPAFVEIDRELYPHREIYQQPITAALAPINEDR